MRDLFHGQTRNTLASALTLSSGRHLGSRGGASQHSFASLPQDCNTAVKGQRMSKKTSVFRSKYKTTLHAKDYRTSLYLLKSYQELYDDKTKQDCIAQDHDCACLMYSTTTAHRLTYSTTTVHVWCTVQRLCTTDVHENICALHCMVYIHFSSANKLH